MKRTSSYIFSGMAVQAFLTGVFVTDLQYVGLAVVYVLLAVVVWNVRRG